MEKIDDYHILCGGYDGYLYLIRIDGNQMQLRLKDTNKIGNNIYCIKKLSNNKVAVGCLDHLRICNIDV
jgi:hypothetical protein